ncbi:cysteine proteinase [Parathielavia appendiculata]|uniref:Ubiquitin carboxyl-terminal hydrolase n=1 Tax=Parathielavia appendiculata TaxID=2587402 RepID=A0AAN6U8A2_9PEZI|nr:cysteine proteinase [Parathielavia appendiculata]
MPDKTLRVVTYAAGASLAAITLIYVFGPTYFLDNDDSSSSRGTFSNRNKGVVGLSNPANDCFINSVLQALAGLGDLRLYLIRETHRRSLDDESVYAQPVPAGAMARDERFRKDIPEWKLEGLQRGFVTKSLKEILDALNERPIYRKTISALPFVRALEVAFGQRISRQQQDAQEFLQVVAERLCDEYHAGCRARQFVRRIVALGDDGKSEAEAVAAKDMDSEKDHCVEEEEGFPLEGRFESQIECLTCGFRPRPTASNFCTLTLNVPLVSSTTLGACFDGMFKTEIIDDFKCEKCRLLHALAHFESTRVRAASEAARAETEAAVAKLRLTIATDPEKPPEDVQLPDLRYAPKRRIARHIAMTKFPKILAIHLSRSIFDASHSSLKNSAKVAFPEELPLGGLLRQQKYKLLSVVTHKGSHNSGHYESFRRQNVYPPFSNPSTFQASGVYSRTASPASTPRIPAHGDGLGKSSCSMSLTPEPLTDESKFGLSPASLRRAEAPAGSSRSSLCNGTSGGEKSGSSQCPVPAGVPRGRDSAALNAVAGKGGSPLARPAPAAKPKQRKQQARWWRISDDKVKEASTRDVLSMQRDVYMLFYEMERLH